MEKYALIFRQNQAQEANWSEEGRATSQKNWGGWIQELMKENAFIEGHRFTDQGYVISPSKKPIEGIYQCDKLSHIGYFIIYAENIERARQIALGCPLMAEGGTLEVRAIMNQ